MIKVYFVSETVEIVLFYGELPNMSTPPIINQLVLGTRLV